MMMRMLKTVLMMMMMVEAKLAMRLDVARAGMLVRVFRKVLWGLRGVPPTIKSKLIVPPTNKQVKVWSMSGPVPIRNTKKILKSETVFAIVDR